VDKIHGERYWQDGEYLQEQGGWTELQRLASWDLSQKAACECLTALELVARKH